MLTRAFARWLTLVDGGGNRLSCAPAVPQNMIGREEAKPKGTHFVRTP